MPASRTPRCFQTTDGGQTWRELPALRNHPSAAAWQPGAGGMCLHTILLDPSHPGRIFIAISAAGVFRSDDGAESWRPINRGLRSEQISRPDRRGRHCVHRIAMHPVATQRAVHAEALDVMRSDDAGESWKTSAAICRPIWIPDRRALARAEYDLRRPDQERLGALCADGKLRVYRSRTGGQEWEALTKGLPQSHCYVNVLRDAMAVDSLDPCGVYFGTSGGQVYGSADAGDSWTPIVRDLPPWCPSRLRLCHDPGGLAGSSTDARARRRRGEARGRGQGHTALGPRRARGVLPDAARDDP